MGRLQSIKAPHGSGKRDQPLCRPQNGTGSKYYLPNDDEGPQVILVEIIVVKICHIIQQLVIKVIFQAEIMVPLPMVAEVPKFSWWKWEILVVNLHHHMKLFNRVISSKTIWISHLTWQKALNFAFKVEWESRGTQEMHNQYPMRQQWLANIICYQCRQKREIAKRLPECLYPSEWNPFSWSWLASSICQST